MKQGRNIITRGLPKTGQVIEYEPGDDGTYEAGWWKSRLNSNNRTRWNPKTIGGDDVVIDRATGLMWAANGTAIGCFIGVAQNWPLAVSTADGLTFAGFSDWRLPNIQELSSIVNFGKDAPSIDQPPFSNTYSDKYWSSTTYHPATGYAWRCDFNNGGISAGVKLSDSYYMRCVRKGL